mmetsp:Transcript_18570/g.36394  ORF Transcript_18570/g.36394 Transcript_18570/m.36394 type:complete len:237 (-) Transcript_18570:1674-2384(-)
MDSNSIQEFRFSSNLSGLDLCVEEYVPVRKLEFRVQKSKSSRFTERRKVLTDLRPCLPNLIRMSSAKAERSLPVKSRITCLGQPRDITSRRSRVSSSEDKAKILSPPAEIDTTFAVSSSALTNPGRISVWPSSVGKLSISLSSSPPLEDTRSSVRLPLLLSSEELCRDKSKEDSSSMVSFPWAEKRGSLRSEMPPDDSRGPRIALLKVPKSYIFFSGAELPATYTAPFSKSKTVEC